MAILPNLRPSSPAPRSRPHAQLQPAATPPLALALPAVALQLRLGICPEPKFSWEPGVPGTRNWVLLVTPAPEEKGESGERENPATTTTSTSTTTCRCVWYNILGGPKEEKPYKLQVVRKGGEEACLHDEEAMASVPAARVAEFEEVVGDVVLPRFSHRWVRDVLEVLGERGFEMEEGALAWVRVNEQVDPFEGRDRAEVMGLFKTVAFRSDEEVKTKGDEGSGSSGSEVPHSGDTTESEGTPSPGGDDEDWDLWGDDDDLPLLKKEDERPLTYELWQSLPNWNKIQINKPLLHAYKAGIV
ncbi:hypothetical protein B0T16DRAFT_387748 [Cercophora newfieldiana]|uniref:Uncharacterized protein n=1 Tax=Cercophora newfieldiana TaxID=92897 RepID=A0AA39YIC4_9PEZI|nr:hypothetical protein B0T16DRAFT_387748 [Cercophora newfieldiana]